MGGLLCAAYFKISCCPSKIWSNLVWSYFYVAICHWDKIITKHTKTGFVLFCFLCHAGDLGSKDFNAKVSSKRFSWRTLLHLILKTAKTSLRQERKKPGKTKPASLKDPLNNYWYLYPVYWTIKSLVQSYCTNAKSFGGFFFSTNLITVICM